MSTHIDAKKISHCADRVVARGSFARQVYCGNLFNGCGMLQHSAQRLWLYWVF